MASMPPSCESLTSNYDPRRPVITEDHGRPKSGVVIVSHCETVGASSRNGHQVPDARLGDQNAGCDDISRLAVLADQISQNGFGVPFAEHQRRESLPVQGG